jgi:hypothetical protein
VAPFVSQTFAVAVASVAALGALASPAAGQPAGYGDPYKAVVNTAPSPYWGYTFTPYVATPLHGVAEIARARGDFLIKREQAALLREQVRQDKLVTRRLQLEHWEWECDLLAGSRNRERERVRQAEVERGRTFPPLTEILAAVSLNSLRDELVKRPDLPAAGSTPVEAEWLAHVHVTVDGRGNAGLLKGDKIFWPQLLLRADFADSRAKIKQLLDSAKKQVLGSPGFVQVNPEVLRELRQCVAGCRERVHAEIRRGDTPGWGWRHFIGAKRFLQEVDDTIFLLERPDAAYYLSPLRGSTVAELVAHMKKEGVRFAPATVGCERAYIALHRALADELTRLQNQQPTPKQP